MIKILKADFRKFFSGKLFIAMTVLAIVFPLLSAVLFRMVINNAEIGPLLLNAETAFFGAFSPLNNYGLMLMIFIIILLMAEFNQNTIRNKVVAGYSKNTIYLASTVFTLSIAFIAKTLHAFLTYFLVKYFVGAVGDSFSVILKHWLVAILATLVLYAFVQMITFVFKTFGLSFGVVLGTLFLFSIILYALAVSPDEKVKDVLEVIIIITPLMHLLETNTFVAAHIPWMILSNVIMIVLNIGLGLYLNKRLDYK